MRVLIVGGYGVFGERLARLLLRDGHRVWVAGRDLAAAERLAAEIGCEAVRFDRGGGLAGLAGFEVVVDAAGPFHAYGADPYRLARAAIAAGVHYLDFSDNAGFCTGIVALDAVAKAAGVCVISGLSSVPALSSAAVVALAGPDPVRVIDVAILPGNRAPRGLSVMASILAQAGQPMPVWRGRQWDRMRGWSDLVKYDLPGGVARQGWRIMVPDALLFPAAFGAESVRFSAGLELGVMRYGLAGFAAVQRVLNLRVGRGLVRLFKAAADLLAPFGTGQGGMVVKVVAGGQVRVWRLLAAAGDGPCIPAIPARALLRRTALPVGARPAVGVITLAEAEAAIGDLRVRTERLAVAFTPIFPRVLGPGFHDLPAEIRATHDTADCSRWQGMAQVDRGRGLWPGLLAVLFGMPPAAKDVAVTVTKQVTPQGETWVRQFGRHRFRSDLAATPQGMTERFGPFTFLLGLWVADGALHYPVKAARIGPMPLPQRLLPRVEAREFGQDGRFRFDVALFAPVSGGLIVRYRGWLQPAAPGDPSRPFGANGFRVQQPAPSGLGQRGPEP